MKTIVLTGGGSAGHVVPNLALLPALQKLCRAAYVGTDGIERRLVREAGIPFYTVNAPKLVRGAPWRNLTLWHRLRKSVAEAEAVLQKLSPALVFSKGGYAALPAALAANRLGIPVVTHESDLSPGLANRVIARRAVLTLTGFPETAARLPRAKYAGAPVRGELFAADRAAALRRYGFSGAKPVLLCFGGGSGSAALSAALGAALPALLPRFDVLHIRGRAAGAAAKPGYVCTEFERDMAAAYAAADYVLARAGANTVFELLALKKPALLVPLENRRSRGDQVENALYFSRRGLVHVLRERQLSPAALQTALQALQADTALPAALHKSGYRAGNAAIVRELAPFLA